LRTFLELEFVRKPPHSGASRSVLRTDRRPEGAYAYGTASPL